MNIRIMVALALTLIGCPGSLDDPSRFLTADAGPCTVDDVEPVIFANTCAGAGCHQTFDGGSPASNNLDLVAPGIKARVRKQVSSCSGIPMAAYLLEKVKPTATCAGSRMPLARPPLAANQIACIEAWVASVLDGGTADGGQ